MRIVNSGHRYSYLRKATKDVGEEVGQVCQNVRMVKVNLKVSYLGFYILHREQLENMVKILDHVAISELSAH